MWSRLYKNISSIVGKKEPTPEKVIKMALDEIQQAIKSNTIVLDKTRQKQSELRRKLTKAQLEVEDLHAQAMNAVKKRDERTAQNLLKQKNEAQKYSQQLESLFEHVTHTVNKMTNQVRKLNIQMEEIKTKEVILINRLQSAESHKSAMENLEQLDSDFHLDLFEEEVTRAELENDLLSGIDETDQAIDNALADTGIEEIKEEISKEKELQNQVKAEARSKKINQVFQRLEALDNTNSAPRPVKSKPAPKVEVDKWFEETSKQVSTTKDSSPKHNMVDDFFTEEPKEEEKSQSPSPTKPIKDNELINDFFKSDEKQKKIDDFFND